LPTVGSFTYSATPTGDGSTVDAAESYDPATQVRVCQRHEKLGGGSIKLTHYQKLSFNVAQVIFRLRYLCDYFS
jgi:hypothetical protein